jgi:hypothetical protein
MVRFISIAVTAAMILGASAPAFAGDKHHGGGGKSGGVHRMGGLRGGKGLGGDRLGVAAAIIGLALDAMQH